MDMVLFRRVYGDDAATATLVRNILRPVADLLSGDASDLHRRLVLVEFLDTSMDARAAFEPFGAVEAVATYTSMLMAVVVFQADAGAGAALALRQGPMKRPIGSCKPVPPLDLAAPYDLISSTEIKVSGPAVERAAAAGRQPPPEPNEEALALAFREMYKCKPMIEYCEPAHKVCGDSLRGPPGTKRFVPSEDSLVYGPKLGGDGHLWMHGSLLTSDEYGCQFGHNVWVRVRQQIGPMKIRVTPLSPIVYVT